MKKYKNGLVLGKMFPFTTGHKYLIDTAIENCENVYVIVCHNKTQNIDGYVRFNAIESTYKINKNVSVYLADDSELPQYESECETLDEFYDQWVPFVYDIVDDLDVVFTSEDYGDDFARYLGIDHYLVDKERKKFPISGTKVRANPLEHWEFIPNEMRKTFIKRVAIMGPESVGKSTLSKILANYFDTRFVEEYGRRVFEVNNSVTIDDFIPISEGRQSLEDWLVKSSNKVIFCDTEDITTYIFSKMYHPDEYKKVENWFLESLNKKPKYDLYILLKPDCDAIQDGTRQFLDERINHYDVIKSELSKRDCNFVEIGGSWKDRLDKSIEIVKSEFNI